MATSMEHGISPSRSPDRAARARALDVRRARLRRRVGRHDERHLPESRGPAQRVIPDSPRVVLHNPVLAFENGAEFLQAWYDAEDDRLDPFLLVVEGAIGDERLSGAGHWTGFGVDPFDGQPITVNEWIDRLAPKAAAVVAVGTCATYGGVPAMKNNPTGAMGLPDFLGWSWKSHRGVPIVCIPGCPAQPDNMTSILLELILFTAGMGPAPLLDERLRPVRLFGRTTREGCGRAGFTEQGQFATTYGNDPRCLVKLGCKGPAAVCNVPRAAGSTASAAARTPAGSASAARCRASPTSSCRSWTPTRGETRRQTSSASPTARCFVTSASATSC